MNYPKLDDADFERAVTVIWGVGDLNDPDCWLYQKARLEGFILLYGTGEVIEDLALLVKITEYFILRLGCDKDRDLQDHYLDQIIDTDIYHSMNMIKLEQSLLAKRHDPSETHMLREKLDDDYMLMGDQLARWPLSDVDLDRDELSTEEKTQMVCDRIDSARMSMERGMERE